MKTISQSELWQARRATVRNTKGWRNRRNAQSWLDALWEERPFVDYDLADDLAPRVLDIRAIRALCDTLQGVFPPVRRVSLPISELGPLLSPALQESEVRILRQTLCRAERVVLSIDLEAGELDGWGQGNDLLDPGRRVLTLYFYRDNSEEE